MEIPFALAFTAGLVATLNPCGFAMLPAYLSYFVGVDADRDGGRGSAIRRALWVGTVVSAGFLVVFGIAGILISAGVQAVVDLMPWIALVVGVGLVVLGIAVIFGLELRARLPKPGGGGTSSGNGGVFVFGVSYAIASLSCTLPGFLVVVAGTIPQLGFVAGLVTFLVYGLGMAAMLMVVTLALAVGHRTVIDRLRASGRYIERAAGGILALAGGYIVFFWATTLAGDPTSQPAAVVWVEQLSARLTNLATDHAAIVGIVAAVAVVAAGIAVRVAARRDRSGSVGTGSAPTDEAQGAVSDPVGDPRR